MDLLLSRYAGGIEFILDMSFDDAINLIWKAFEKRRDDELFQIWLTYLPNMDKDTYMSFEQYKEQVLNAHKAKLAKQIRSDLKDEIAKANSVSDDEAINEAENILQMMNGNGFTSK